MDAQRTVGVIAAERWAHLKSLFEQALDVAPHDRGIFAAAACANDPSLERSLLALLSHHEAATVVLAGPMLTPERMAEIVSSGLRTFVPGELVAERFRILQFIAEGGMGEVYAADDLELHETVALKTVRPALANTEKVLTRFRQEILLARKVTHRNVSRVFDFFRHEVELDGEKRTIFFLSMELLPGETLSSRIRRLGPLPIVHARDLAIQLIAGLEAAHASGIVHRDFKTGNIAIVAESESGERAVIMDFGLAGTKNSLTNRESDGLIGTPAYMAPEQVENGPITPATDIYSLGIVLFEMISSRLPFEGSTPLETARLRLVKDPPLLRNVAPQAPLGWERAISACLQRDPAKRPASATDVAAHLTGRFERRRRTLALAAGVCALSLGAGGLYLIRQPHRPAAAAQAAIDGARVKLKNNTPAGFKEAIADFHRAIELDTKWAVPWTEIAYTYATAANAGQASAATASMEARAAALEAIRLDDRSAKAFGALGWVQSLDLDEWPKAEETLRHALALDPSDAQIHYWLGVHLRKKGKFPEAEAEDREALALSHQSDPLIWCELAFLYWTAGENDRMGAFLNDLLVAFPNFGLTRFLNARFLKEQGNFDKAISELQFSEDLQYPAVTVQAERASVDAYRGNTTQAFHELRGLEKTSRTQPVDDLLIAGVYAKLGDFDAAFNWLEKGLARRDSTLLSLATSPVLKPLRADNRFASLMRRLHFVS